MEYIKVSDNEIKVVEIKEVVEEKVYSCEMLLDLKANLEAEKIRVIGNIDEKLVGVNVLLAKCEKLGIKEKPIEEEPIEPIK